MNVGGKFFEYATRRFQCDSDFVLEAVENCGLTLEYTSKQPQCDKILFFTRLEIMDMPFCMRLMSFDVIYILF